MEWKKPTEPPIELKPVLAWIRYYSMPSGEIAWREEKKIEKHGYALAYIDAGVWWDGRATVNSKPIEVIGWMELPTPPSDGSTNNLNVCEHDFMELAEHEGYITKRCTKCLVGYENFITNNL